MRKNASLLLLVLVAAAIFALFAALDPLGIWKAIDRDEREQAELDSVRHEPSLESRPDAAARSRGAHGSDPVGVLDLGKGTASLHGTVTGRGTPLDGARVVAVVPGATDRGVRTKSDGTWEVRGLPAGRFDVRASAEGWRSKTVVAPDVRADATALVEPIDLTATVPLTDGIEAKVTDEFGRPIPGAKVLATTIPWGLHLSIGPELAGIDGVVSRTATTDERGIASLAAMPPERYDVVAVSPGRQTAYQQAVQAVRGRVVHILFRLEPGVAITGTVLDVDGQPVVDGYVTGLHQPTFASSLTVHTGKDGTFTLDGLRKGRYMVIAGHPDKGMVTATLASPSGGHTLELQGSGTIEGDVVTADGKPVPSFKIRAYLEDWFGYQYSLVRSFDDPEGKFRFHQPPGSWHLLVQLDGGTLSSSEVATIAAGETAKVHVVMPATGIVRGVVVDPDGNHLAGAEVFVKRGGVPQGPSREQYARTDEEGKFVVRGLPVETTRLHARRAGFAEAVFEVMPTLLEDGPETTVRLTSGAQIEGRVADAKGKGVAGEQVNLMLSGDFFDPTTTRTDDDGAFAFRGLSAGTYTATTGPFEQGARGQSKQGIVVGAEGTVRLDFVTETVAGTAEVFGIVRRAGSPVDGATVYVSTTSTDAVSATTDPSGAFRTPGIPAGQVRIYVRAMDGGSKTVTIQLPVEGLTAPVLVEIGSTTVRGLVVSPSGGPVSGAWIEVDRAGQDAGTDAEDSGTWTSSGLDGTFRLGGIDPGPWQVRVNASGYAPLLTPPFSLADGETKDLGRLQVDVGASLSGRVTDDAGTPIENATVNLEDSSGRPVFSFSIATSGSDGRYRVPELKAGDYSAKFQARGYGTTILPIHLGESGAKLDAVLPRGGTVRARVQDAEGAAVTGIRVMLIDSRGQTVTRTLSLATLGEGSLGMTDTNGIAEVPDLAAGTYRVTARRPGLTLESEPTATVAPGGSAEVVLVMRPEGG